MQSISLSNTKSYHKQINTSNKIIIKNNINAYSDDTEIIIHKNQTNIYSFLLPKQTSIYDFMAKVS